MKGKLIIFSAPSGSGKTTIIKEIIKSDIPFVFSISATTRSPRNHEINGKDYIFLSVDEFKLKIKKQEFLEFEEVYPNQFYGTLKSDVETILEKGENVIFDVDVVGALNIKKYYGDKALAIFIKPPSIEELEKRLKNRGTEDETSIQKRISKAEHEMKFIDKFDKIIINENLETAIKICQQEIIDFLNK